VIELTAPQVEEVVLHAADDGTLPFLLAGFEGLPDTTRTALAEEAPALLRDGRLSRSLLVGLIVLAAFPRDGSFIAVTAIAAATGTSASTAHRYCSTLLAARLIERDPRTRQYRLARRAAHDAETTA
jgi:hypothetical protein